MVQTPPQSKRANRSNAYSESKCSNWMAFDPYRGELSTIPRNFAPVVIFPISEGENFRIFELPLHPDFMRPFDAHDVESTLKVIPSDFLLGLKAIYLMGGTRKQEKIAFCDSARWGAYGDSSIYLYAFPRRTACLHLKGVPKPDIRQGYERAGATYEQTQDGWIFRFDELSLKRYYLRDVLLHEIAHHVDRFNEGIKNSLQAERFAEGFVREYGFGKLK